MRRKCVAGVSVLLLVAGCSSDRAAPEPALTEAWRLASISPTGQPVALGDTLVVYGTVHEDLYLYGVAVADGSVRWRQAASPSAVVSGISVEPSVIDGRVAYFRPDPSGRLAARLVVAVPETGDDILVSEPARFSSHPRICAGGNDVCVTVLGGGGRRFSVEARGPVPDPGAPPPHSRFLGTDLLDLGERDPEILAGFRDGAIRWRSPLSRHFSAGHTSDKGWYFLLYRSAGLHVGSVGRAAERDDPAMLVRDLGKSEVAPRRLTFRTIRLLRSRPVSRRPRRAGSARARRPGRRR